MTTYKPTDPATAPGHTDLMISPEAIDNLFDRNRIAKCLRDLAGHLDTVPAQYPVAELLVAADMIDGTI